MNYRMKTIWKVMGVVMMGVTVEGGGVIMGVTVTTFEG